MLQREPRRRRVTVIEDSHEVLEMLGDALRFDGLDVSLLAGGTTFDDIQASEPDLLVMDWRLSTSNLTGLEVIRHARSGQALRDVPIIVCTGATNEVSAHADELAETPQVFVLAKPFALEELEGAVQQAFGEQVQSGAPQSTEHPA